MASSAVTILSYFSYLAGRLPMSPVCALAQDRRVEMVIVSHANISMGIDEVMLYGLTLPPVFRTTPKPGDICQKGDADLRRNITTHPQASRNNERLRSSHL